MSKNRCNSTVSFLVDDIENLTPGHVPKAYIEELYEFMRPASAEVKEAVIKHLCDGVLQSTAADEFGVKQGNISRQVKRLTEINEKIFRLKEYIT